MTPENKAGNVTNFCQAVANTGRELIGAGIDPEAVAAGLRIEAARIERQRPTARMTTTEAELIELSGRTHEFINTLQVAGINERTAIVVIGNVLVERVARSQGAAGAAHWLRGLATLVEANGDSFEATAQAR